MAKLFITGLRETDWLAAYLGKFFSVSNRPLAKCTDGGIEALAGVILNSDIVVDPMLPLFQDQILSKYPDSIWLIIDTSVDSVEYQDGIDPVVVKEKLEYLAQKAPLAHRVDAYNVRSSSSLRDIHVLVMRLGLKFREVDVDWLALLYPLQITGKSDINNSPALAKQVEPRQEGPTNQEYYKVLEEMLQTQPEAYVLLTQMFDLALVWDHIIDDDGVDKAIATRAFKNLFSWPQNPFYQKYGLALSFAMVSIISSWEWSNDPKSRNKAKAIDFYTEMPTLMAFIVGGQSHVDHYMPRVRELIEQGWAEDGQRDQHPTGLTNPTERVN